MSCELALEMGDSIVSKRKNKWKHDLELPYAFGMSYELALDMGDIFDSIERKCRYATSVTLSKRKIKGKQCFWLLSRATVSTYGFLEVLQSLAKRFQSIVVCVKNCDNHAILQKKFCSHVSQKLQCKCSIYSWENNVPSSEHLNLLKERLVQGSCKTSKNTVRC